MFEGFAQFPFNRRDEQPFHPHLACWGNFNPGFDKQPGIEQARKNCLEMCYLSEDERRQIIEDLESRGIHYCSVRGVLRDMSEFDQPERESTKD